MADAGAGEKLKVFISYSRKDSTAFVDELVAGLEYGGFAPFLDRHDIVAGEEWEARLGGLIEQSDTVVFIVSPEPVILKSGAGHPTRKVCRCESAARLFLNRLLHEEPDHNAHSDQDDRESEELA
jgi:hypothetical protein